MDQNNFEGQTCDKTTDLDGKIPENFIGIFFLDLATRAATLFIPFEDKSWISTFLRIDKLILLSFGNTSILVDPW